MAGDGDNNNKAGGIPRVEFPADVRRDTLAVREGLPPSAWGENSEALFITSSYVHPDAATAARRFSYEEEAFVYSRFSNPTVTMMERRLAALESTEACIGTSSGMSAYALIVFGLLGAGDHIVCSRSMFGATIKLLSEFGRFGIETSFVSQTDVAEWRAAVRPTTRLLIAETPTNPLTDVCDIAALAAVARDCGALLAVDNSFCSPALQRPAELGADLVLHSGTKFLDGQGRVIAGAVCATQAIVDGKLTPAMRSIGMSLSPFNAWIVLKGMETLSVRMRAHCERASLLAHWLEEQPAVQSVHYPGLASHPQHRLAMAQQSGMGGAVVSFKIGGADADAQRQRAFHVIDSTRICSITANLGDTKTTITHPSSTTHGRLSEAQRQAVGLTQGMIRVAVGLEDIDDIKADVLRGLATLSAH